MIELDGEVLEGFIEHLRAHFRQELLEELEEVERASWEPVRQHLKRMRNQPSWAEVQARRGQHHQVADAERAAQENESQEPA
ncbi:hypothetical protein GXW83_27520 [Streptacidiphilus sp. PB12-B1b]|uniref:hypothetical protein n=1 Tax=Streptacidiphilus sp. PB12-B1b TaxID=2705012 RepID=UPI0015FAEE0A|nr:hypothetical protein [Streptacidiphilus sp. PB12-B1b]QMU78895.1 hypothetical protein GXW83_27520 [Streptacidiphilus sp. PB12-B1b]